MDSVVRLVPSGLRFDARRASLLHVDDAAGLLLVVAGSEVAAYSLAAPGAPPRVTRIEEGAPVRPLSVIHHAQRAALWRAALQ